jgi:hypothetical protein
MFDKRHMEKFNLMKTVYLILMLFCGLPCKAQNYQLHFSNRNSSNTDSLTLVGDIQDTVFHTDLPAEYQSIGHHFVSTEYECFDLTLSCADAESIRKHVWRVWIPETRIFFHTGLIGCGETVRFCMDEIVTTAVDYVEPEPSFVPFPNPFVDNIRFGTVDVPIVILDLIGNIVYQGPGGNIDTSDFIPGSYIIASDGNVHKITRQ